MDTFYSDKGYEVQPFNLAALAACSSSSHYEVWALLVLSEFFQILQLFLQWNASPDSDLEMISQVKACSIEGFERYFP